MIGFMVPNVSADEYVDVKSKKDHYSLNEPLVFSVSVKTVFPNSSFNLEIFNEAGTYTGLRHGGDPEDDNGVTNLVFRPQPDLPSGTYVAKVIYGSHDDPFGIDSTTFTFEQESDDVYNQLIDYLMLTKFDIGSDYEIRDIHGGPSNKYNFCMLTYPNVANAYLNKFENTCDQMVGVVYDGPGTYDYSGDVQVILSYYENGSNPGFLLPGGVYNIGYRQVTEFKNFECSPTVQHADTNTYWTATCDNDSFNLHFTTRDKFHPDPDTFELFMNSIIDNINQNPISSTTSSTAQIPTQPAYSYEPTHVSNFPDPTKSPQHYLDRYNNEDAYREWFDSQFPDRTIYDVLGIPESLQPDPEPEPVVNKIPEWVKNIFTWYAQDQISEDEVLNAIKFLVNQGIINLDE